jgi:hypothetical protein
MSAVGRLASAVGLVVFIGASAAAHLPDEARMARVARLDQGLPDLHPSLVVTNPRTMAELEVNGFSFGDVLGVRQPGESRSEDYAEESAEVLARRSPIYSQIVESVRGDIYDMFAVGRGVGNYHNQRLFDPTWLTSRRVHYELVGAVNRIDFRLLATPGCGQTRLLYRLTLRPDGRPETYLPLTINVEYENTGSSCTALAQQWLALEGADQATIGLQLRSGPLSALSALGFQHIEINFQSLRQNSSSAATEDHAEYVLRSFDVTERGLVPTPLRNTPDVAMNAASREALRRWIAENLDGIEAGSAELPVEWAATTASSLTPHGLNRRGNTPYSEIFPDHDAAFGDLSFVGRRRVTSAAALVRRLDEMTCVGCHQSRSLAGFHLLGEERRATATNALVTGLSNHLREILPWRLRFLRAAANGEVPSEPLPFAERADSAGGYGSHCSLTADLPGWACTGGLVCHPSDVDGDKVGVCLPEGFSEVGDPCEKLSLLPEAGSGHRPDDILSAPREPCKAERGKLSCHLNHDGFPGGMCGGYCTTEGERDLDGICVRIPHMGFEGSCFRKDETMEHCLTKPGVFSLDVLRPCSRSKLCRDDYACARLPRLSDGPESGKTIDLDDGACVPPYFVFQLRVDGPPIDRKIGPEPTLARR